MIIELFLELIFKIFSLLTSVINIPQLPSSVDGYLSGAFQYIDTGIRFLGNFLPLEYFSVLFGIIIAIDVGVAVYHFVMWIIRKIPMAGMS